MAMGKRRAKQESLWISSEEIVQDSGNEWRVVFSDACFERSFVVTEQIVDHSQSWRPVFEAAQTLYGAAVHLRKIAGSNEAACRGAFRVDLARIVFPANTGSDCHPPVVPR